MVILPSDHVIKVEKTFIEVIKSAIEKARVESNLVTIGIKPS